MASWLMHLKSKRLLPKQEKEEEEEITEEELARRLAQYKKYRDATPEITERYRYWSRAYYKMPEALEFPKKYALPEIDPDAFAECFAEVRMRWRLRRNDDREKMERILKVEKVSLRDKMKQVVKSVFHRARAKFSELFPLKKAAGRKS